jgi:glycosyltransferase involved in cell wall biosynthesis
VKAVFVHDHRFVVEEAVYSATYPYASWRRYLEHFDALTVVGRRARAGAEPGAISRSSGPGVAFALGDGMSSVRALLGLERRESRRLAGLVAEHDAVIARVPSEYGLAAARLARKLAKPCLIEVVACTRDSYWHHSGIRAKLYAPVATARVRRAVGAADWVNYVTRDFLQRRYPARREAVISAISNVEIENPDPAVLAGRMQRIRDGRSRVVFGLIGSLKTRYKGVQVAIEALAGLDRGAFDFELRVLGAGDGSHFRRLAERAGLADRVFLDGTRPAGADVWRWLDHVDVYLQPSLSEGLPRALIEALSRACPAIASSVGGIPELLDEACTVPPGDAGALKDRIRTKAFDPDWRQQQAARNFETAGRYSPTVLGRERSALLRGFALAAR